MFQRLLNKREALRHANLGIDREVGRELFIIAKLGPRPGSGSSPATERAHLHVQDKSLIPELQADVHMHEEGLPPYHWAIGPLCCLVALTELAASWDLLGLIDAPPLTRLLMASGIALAVLGLAAVAASRRGPEGIKSSLWMKGAYALFVCVAVASAIVRADRLGDGEESSALVAWSTSLLLAVAASVPPLLAKGLFAKWAETRRARSALAHTRQRLRQSVKGVNRAERDLDRQDAVQRRWDREAAVLAARYDLDHRTAAARRSESVNR